MVMMMPVRVAGTKMLMHSPIPGVKNNEHGFPCSPEVQKELGGSCCFGSKL